VSSLYVFVCRIVFAVDELSLALLLFAGSVVQCSVLSPTLCNYDTVLICVDSYDISVECAVIYRHGTTYTGAPYTTKSKLNIS